MEGVGKAFVERLGNTPSHQQVGKNDSFWLPPESKSEAFSHKLKAAHSKLGEKNLPQSEDNRKGVGSRTKAGNPSQINGGSVTKSGLPAKTSQPAKLGVVSGEKVKVSNTFSARNTPSHSIVLHKPEALTHQNHSLPLNNSFKGNLRDSGWPSMVGKNEVNPDADSEVHDNRRNLSHGTKSATLSNDMEVSFKTQLSLELAGRELTAVSRESSPQARTFFEFAGKELLPRIAYFAKQDKKVVRFAMDLPNGSKLGVRLEKSKNSLNLCLISSDDHSQKMLEQLKSILGKFSEGESGSGQLRVFHFQNYKEMDNYFHQAA